MRQEMFNDRFSENNNKSPIRAVRQLPAVACFKRPTRCQLAQETPGNRAGVSVSAAPTGASSGTPPRLSCAVPGALPFICLGLPGARRGGQGRRGSAGRGRAQRGLCRAAGGAPHGGGWGLVIFPLSLGKGTPPRRRSFRGKAFYFAPSQAGQGVRWSREREGRAGASGGAGGAVTTYVLRAAGTTREAHAPASWAGHSH